MGIDITQNEIEVFFIAKYDSAGAFQWIRKSEADTYNVVGLDVSANSASVFATGTTFGSAAFGSLSLSVSFGARDVFIIKYDGDGNEQWLINGGSNSNDYATAVSADETDVYFAGNFIGVEMELTDTSGTIVSTLSNVSNKEDILSIPKKRK